MGIINFGEDKTKHIDSIASLGVRGERIAELSQFGVNISPGFIIDNEILTSMGKSSIRKVISQIQPHISKIESTMGRYFGDSENPLLIKVIESPTLNIIQSKANVHNIGLCDSTVNGFGRMVGNQFAWKEYCNMVQRVISINLELASGAQHKQLANVLKVLKGVTSLANATQAIANAKKVLPSEFFTDPFQQLAYMIQLIYRLIHHSENASDSSLLLQTVVFGNYNKKSCYGTACTRNIVDGDSKLYGSFYPNSFNERGTAIPINKMGLQYKEHFSTLQALSKKLEATFKEIRRVIFTVEDEKLWVIDQRSVNDSSAQANLRVLLDLKADKVIDDDYIIKNFDNASVSELLHPSLDSRSVANLPQVSGGIAGAVGSASGRVFFDANSLVEEYRRATLHKEDSNLILAMTSTFAEDVKAIEVASAVITSEGGYASHAPVVARSLGKVAWIHPDMKFSNKQFTLGKISVKQGDYITIDVPFSQEPVLYKGKGRLVKPDVGQSGLVPLMEITEKYLKNIHIRANADQPHDATIARLFGAKGIGLCRTEHMFFDPQRINTFRSMIIAQSEKERRKALNKIESFQIQDFVGLFKVMKNFPVTIRLLDAPLHEFLPSSLESMSEFISYFRKQNPQVKGSEIRERCALLDEFNPMLGHRGVRLAFSYPEIYKMQIRAIFKAVQIVGKQNIAVKPEIMIPMIMLPSEIKAIRNGKAIEGKAIRSIEEIRVEVQKETKSTKKIEYSIGGMIELPSAALSADKIACYTNFLCFGTNDLSQTTNGLSRDDFTTFASDYSEYDLVPHNLFQVLGDAVKELISIAVERSRLARPDIELGLCGEHGADPANIPFIVDVGLDYISCSPFGIPIAKLSLAKHILERSTS